MYYKGNSFIVFRLTTGCTMNYCWGLEEIQISACENKVYFKMVIKGKAVESVQVCEIK